MRADVLNRTRGFQSRCCCEGGGVGRMRMTSESQEGACGTATPYETTSHASTPPTPPSSTHLGQEAAAVGTVALTETSHTYRHENALGRHTQPPPPAQACRCCCRRRSLPRCDHGQCGWHVVRRGNIPPVRGGIERWVRRRETCSDNERHEGYAPPTPPAPLVSPLGPWIMC